MRNAVALHNLGNISYKEERLEDALSFYSGSLSITEHPDTRFNYEYVNDLLKKREISDENMQEDQNGQDATPNDSGSGEKDENMNEWWNTGENTQEESSESSSWESLSQWAWERGEEYILDDAEDIDEMTQEERALLEQELERLEKQQVYNQKYFNKQSQESFDPFDEMRNSFFGNIYRGGEKDW